MQTSNLPMADVPALEQLERETGHAVWIDNDANCAALAEHHRGAAAGHRHSVTMTLGTGVGGGVVIDGRPFRGATGAGAELGHIVIDRDGPALSRGRARATATWRRTRPARRSASPSRRTRARSRTARSPGAPHGAPADSRLALHAAAEGDAEAVALLQAVGDALGHGLVTLAHAFEPEVFVIGGGFGMAARDWILDPARHVLASEAVHPMAGTPVVSARLGPEAGMLGAAELPRRR